MQTTVPQPFIYLASQSPRRAQLLQQLGISHQLLLADAHEDTEQLEAIHGREAPATYVQRVTQLKLKAAIARALARGLWAGPSAEASTMHAAVGAPILCADTTVALGREILGKPGDAPSAQQMLEKLSGQTHRVLTCVALAWQGQSATQQALALSQTTVTFAPLSPSQIEAYIATQEPFGKAGAYGIQGAAAAFIRRIAGSYSGVMGLPLFETAQLLEQASV